MSGCGDPVKFARYVAKVGRPTAQHSLSVRYALSLIRVVESDRRRTRGGETHGDPAITALPIAISIGGGTATAR
jgi:hypothetical protein